jgi:phage-related protein
VALAEREILLIIRARNMADRALKDVGQQLRGLDGDLDHVGDSFEKAGSDAPSRFKKGFDSNSKSLTDTAAGLGRRFVTTLGLAMQGAVFRSPTIAFALGSALLVIGIPLMAMAGAALASGLVLAFGGGLAALGLISAKKFKVATDAVNNAWNYMVDQFQRASEPFVATWQIIADGMTDAFNYFLPTIKEVNQYLAPVVSAFSDDLFEALRELEPVMMPMAEAFAAMLEALGPQLPEIMRGFADALIDVANTIKENPDVFANLVGDFFDMVNAILWLVARLTELYDLLTSFEEDQTDFLGTMTTEWGKDLEEFADRAKEDWNEFAQAAEDAWVDVQVWAATSAGNVLASLGNIVSGVGQMPGKISNSAKNWWNRVNDYAENMRVTVGQKLQGVVDWSRNNAVRITAATTNWWTTTKTRANDMKIRVQQRLNEVVAWVGTIPGKIASAVSRWWNSVTVYTSRMKIGVQQKLGEVVTWIGTIPGRIVRALGDLGSLLYNAGRNVLQGLLNGLQDKFQQIKEFVWSIGEWIANNKGPRSYDLKLLKPAGEAIMQGLRDGLWGGVPDLERTLKSISDRVSMGGGPSGMGMGSTTGTAGIQRPGETEGGPFGPSGVRAQGRGNVYVEVNTQEINPQKHAADLGWEIVSELGDFSW